MNERKATMNEATVLRDLRMSRGWSLEDLAEKLDGAVSRQSLHKYENGDTTPSPSVLTKIAHVFGVTPLELATGPDCLVEIKAFRKRAGLRAKAEKALRDRFVEEAQKRFAVQFKCEGQLRTKEKLQGFCSGEEPEHAAHLVRQHWSLGEAAIASLTTTMEDHQVHVILLDADEKFDGVCAVAKGASEDLRGYAVGVRRMEAVGRQRLTLAHELGHLVLDTDDEVKAFRFAGALLAPKRVMLQKLGEKRNRIKKAELDALSEELGMSPEAIIHRAYDLEIITKDSYTFWSRLLRRNGVKKEDSIPKEDSTWLHRQVMKGYAERIITEAQARDWLGNEQFNLLAGQDTQATQWDLRKKTKAERAELLSRAAAAAETYYNSDRFDCVAEAGEVYDDGGLS
jgi:Zn-dependent peptidase ImmA (M78 family)/transcriptional regulator with XRE-family HTH domain